MYDYSAGVRNVHTIKQILSNLWWYRFNRSASAEYKRHIQHLQSTFSYIAKHPNWKLNVLDDRFDSIQFSQLNIKFNSLDRFLENMLFLTQLLSTSSAIFNFSFIKNQFNQINQVLPNYERLSEIRMNFLFFVIVILL